MICPTQSRHNLVFERLQNQTGRHGSTTLSIINRPIGFPSVVAKVPLIMFSQFNKRWVAEIKAISDYDTCSNTILITFLHA